MTPVASQLMKTVHLVSSLLLLEFQGHLEWCLERLASWMIVKIHFLSCLIPHTDVLIFFAVETEMEAYALVSSEYFLLGK